MADVEAAVGPGEPGAAPTPPLPPDSLIVVPVRGMVLFPGMVLPVALGRPRSIQAAQRAVREQKSVGIVMQRNAEIDDPLPIDLHRMARSPTSSATSPRRMERIISYARESSGSESSII